tara:strand:- start:30 stop:362 length:333 start_codon:yes stop_codon:yes gene_type:complete
MSDAMLHGILNMPTDLWTDDHLNQVQRHNTYVSASKRIYELTDALEKTKLVKVEHHPDIVNRLRGFYSLGPFGTRNMTPYVMPICIEAASRIEELEATISKLEKDKLFPN